MTFSTVSAAQREQQEEQIKTLIGWTLMGSAVVHLVFLPLMANWMMTASPEAIEEPIEFIVLEEPEPEPEPEEDPPPPEPEALAIPEPEPEPEPLPEPEMVEPEPEPEPEPLPEPEPFLQEQPTPVPEPFMPEPTPEPEPSPAPLIPQEAPSLSAPAPLDPVESPPIAQELETPNLDPLPQVNPVDRLPDPPVVSTVPQPPGPESDWMNDLNSANQPIALDDQEVASSNPFAENIRSLNEPVNEPRPLEPPVTGSLPEIPGEELLTEFPNSDASPEGEELNPTGRSPWNDNMNDTPEEPFNPNIQPTPSSPVINPTPDNTGNPDLFSQLEANNPAPRIEDNQNSTPSNWNSNSDLGLDEPFNPNANSAPPRIAESPAINPNPGSGETGSDFLNDLETPANPYSSGTNTSATTPSTGTGNSDYDPASEPFGGNIGPMDPGRNSGSPAGSPNGSENGSGSVECRRCGKPSYPRIARDAGWEGVVLLSVDIDPSGNVIDVRVAESSGHTALDDSAQDKIRSWKFEPSENGQQNRLVRIPFRLEDS
jgi:TonB family protein